jgi:uncharacterized protein
MTDTSSFLITQPVSQAIPVTAPVLASPVTNGSLPDTLLPEEDYTIKCICDFEDDDGNTVLCEKCDTWQHIECYYHGKKVPDIHNCADCEPRSLDVKRATERQRRLRELNNSNSNESGDRKTKRPTTKSHKKKIKDTNSISEQVNGWSHGRHDSNSVPRDQPPPAKRPKTSHRNSGSISSQTGTPTLSHESHKRAGSTNHTYPSPIKSPTSNGPQMPIYSSEFLHLYDDDRGETDMQSNVHNTISTASALSSWLQDPQALRQVLNKQPSEKTFNFPEQPLDPSKWPVISKGVIADPTVEIEGRHPRWKYLRLETPVRKDDIVGELKGHIGLLQDYSLNPENRFQELRHPEPFVFFHPYLPIYIDARKEGTQFRYVRRSCRPNISLKTYITNEVEYRFCFVATEEIPAGSELTAPWYLDPSVFNRNSSTKDEEMADEEPDRRPIIVSQFLANFGDCACHRPPACQFAAVDLRRATHLAAKGTTGKRKRAKPKQGVSPMSTGHATNSRAGSEALRMPDDDDQADSRSTSGSTGSKPHSRDLTPTSGLAIDAPGLNGSELTDREKRKIAAAERKFEQLEHGQHQGSKKKKRSSGGHLNSTSGSTVRSSPDHQPYFVATDTLRKKQPGYSTASLPTTPSVSMMKPGYIDASTSRGHTGSPPVKLPYSSAMAQRGSNPSPKRRSAPSTPYVPSPLSKPTYVDKGIQCDRDEFDPTTHKPKVIRVPEHLLTPSPPDSKPPTTFVPFAKRLFMQAFGARQQLEAQSQPPPPSALPCPNPPFANAALPVTSEHPAAPAASVTVKQDLVDVDMKDVTVASSVPTVDHEVKDNTATQLPDPTSINPEPAIKPPPPPWPSTAGHTEPFRQPINGYRATELRVQLPPAQQFSNPSPTTPNVSNTPGSTPTSVGQSPWSLTSVTFQTSHHLGSSAVSPSPVKKKLSLGDYMSRRHTSNLAPNNDKPAPLASQPQQPSNPSPAASTAQITSHPKPSESFMAEAKEHVFEESAIEDTPMKEAGDPMAGVTPTTTAPVSDSNV